MKTHKLYHEGKSSLSPVEGQQTGHSQGTRSVSSPMLVTRWPILGQINGNSLLPPGSIRSTLPHLVHHGIVLIVQAPEHKGCQACMVSSLMLIPFITCAKYLLTPLNLRCFMKISFLLFSHHDLVRIFRVLFG